MSLRSWVHLPCPVPTFLACAFHFIISLSQCLSFHLLIFKIFSQLLVIISLSLGFLAFITIPIVYSALLYSYALSPSFEFCLIITFARPHFSFFYDYFPTFFYFFTVLFFSFQVLCYLGIVILFFKAYEHLAYFAIVLAIRNTRSVTCFRVFVYELNLYTQTSFLPFRFYSFSPCWLLQMVVLLPIPIKINFDSWMSVIDRVHKWRPKRNILLPLC